MNCLYSVSVAVFALDPNGNLSLCLVEDSEIVQGAVPFDQESKIAAIEAVKAQLEVNLAMIEFVEMIDKLSHHSNDRINPSKSREVSALYVGVARDVSESYCSVPNIEIMLSRGQKKLALSAFEHLAKTAESQNVGTSFLPELFTIPQLHAIYTQIWPDCKINLPNFRRKMNASGTIVDSYEYIEGAKAYTAGFGSLIEPPFSRISLRNAKS